MRLRENVTLFVLLALIVTWNFSPLQAAKKDSPQLLDPPLGSGKLVFSEDFESTAVGEIPRGFTKSGMVAVVDDVAHTGKKSLRIEPAEKGARRITLKSDVLTKLAGEHWGRLYFKVKLPTPQPQGTGNFPVIHSTLVSGSATSPLSKDPIEVRLLDTVLGPKQKFQYLYNVQPQKRAEFGKGSAYNYQYSDNWTLAEWYVNSATQTYRLFIDGKEIKDVSFSKGAGHFENAEIPEVFESLSFGWNNYQSAGKGFTAWIDDIALSKERIGDLGLPKQK